MTKDKALQRCPECNSDKVLVVEEQSFLINTGEHYCHSVKIQDSNAKARCLTCGWVGEHRELAGFSYD
jgi:Zn finger protein HypA/HybF involved in hydrogenase expression